MIDINQIMDMISWDKSEEEQERGLELGKQVKVLSCFMLPMEYSYNKNVWENCAKILITKSDEQLLGYIERLLDWTEDLNWLGAMLIFDRICRFRFDENSMEVDILNYYIDFTKADKREVWYETLQEIKKAVLSKI